VKRTVLVIPLIVLALAGCSSDAPVVEQPGTSSESTTDDTVDAPTGALPEGFPSDAVPTVEGSVTEWQQLGDTDYTVIIATDTEHALADIEAELTAKGFAKGEAISSDSGGGIWFTGMASSDYSVAVSSAPAEGGGYLVSYTVVKI
jgi:hypothetical protein